TCRRFTCRRFTCRRFTCRRFTCRRFTSRRFSYQVPSPRNNFFFNQRNSEDAPRPREVTHAR
ncbi:MAG TPA: hypothetical protein VNJ06_04815, partial [Gemmatimonadales bacterium]|nr:hypothetical protein [Gemmatimonadales bacterium]